MKQVSDIGVRICWEGKVPGIDISYGEEVSK